MKAFEWLQHSGSSEQLTLEHAECSLSLCDAENEF